MIKGQILYVKESGSQILFDELKDDVIYAHVRVGTIDYPIRSLASILSKGYWEEVYIQYQVSETIEKHAEHDQSSHGNWASSQQGANIDESKMYAAYEKAGLTVEKIGRTSSERQAFESYLEAGHFINQKIRKTSPENLNQEFTANDRKYPANLVTDMDNLIESAPNLKGDMLYRTTSAEAVERLKVGDVIQDKGYMSTTTADLLSPDNGILLLTLSKVSSGRKAIIRIDGNDNQKGLFMPAINKNNPIASFEREVVLPRNTKLRFKGISVLPLSNERGLKIFDFERLP